MTLRDTEATREEPAPPRGRDRSARDVRQFEVGKWDLYFEEALDGQGQEHERNLWWNISDDDSLRLVESLFPAASPQRILEAGCGSGGTTFLVAEKLRIPEVHLCDLSLEALRFAARIEPPTLPQPARFCRSDVFALPYPDNHFDLVWNVGLIEHYPVAGLIEIVREMRRVTRPDGHVVVAIPNRRCLAVIKAAVLGSPFGMKWLHWVAGYRNDTEILYGNREVARLLQQAFGVEVTIDMVGNCLWTSAPDFLVRATQALGRRLQASFLTFFVLPGG